MVNDAKQKDHLGSDLRIMPRTFYLYIRDVERGAVARAQTMKIRETEFSLTKMRICH